MRSSVLGSSRRLPAMPRRPTGIGTLFGSTSQSPGLPFQSCSTRGARDPNRLSSPSNTSLASTTWESHEKYRITSIFHPRVGAVNESAESRRHRLGELRGGGRPALVDGHHLALGIDLGDG